MPMRRLLFLATSCVLACALRPPPRAPPLPARPFASRRAALALPLAAAALAVPSRVAAICSCPNGLNSCVCTDDPPDSASPVTIQKKRADAAGREAVQSRAEIEFYRREDALTYDEGATSQARQKKGGKASKPEGPQISAGASDGPTMVGRGSLTGFGTQNYNEMDKSAARKRFEEILFDTVAKREAEYGFELDAEDIKQIESVLRVKYCGKEGMIGPC